MFKTAATKIAHNSTLPALGGNQDLRPLQDLITAEKTVLISLQKLSVDYSKASEALRTWGLNEGDDLGDILSASTTILNHFSSALSQYASHGHVMRDHLKAIRTREESLEDLKRRRRTVHRKAEDADKKLSKMSPEHKNLAMQTETLNRLRDEIRLMDSDIMTEEAALGDFKRSAARMWMGLKFGGLLECCEKGTIVAEFGKMLISEISEEITQPGLPRPLYYGQSKTESLVGEAHRCINDVTLSTVASVGFRDRRQYDSREQTLPPVPQDTPLQTSSQLPAEGYNWSASEVKSQPPPPVQTDYLSNQKPFAGNYQGEVSSMSPATGTGSSFAGGPYAPHHHQELSASGLSQTGSLQGLSGNPEMLPQIMDDFGVNTRSAGLLDTSNMSGGRFATFPVKTRPLGSAGGYTLQDTPSLGSRQDPEQSFSASIAEALDEKESVETSLATEGAHQPPWMGLRNASNSALPPPPPGAALPDFSNAYGNQENSLQAPSHSRNISQLSNNDDALLAYMTMSSVDDDLHEDERHEPPKPAPSTPKLGAPAQDEEQHRISRHVRFGEVEDVNEEMEKRGSLEKERQAQAANNGDKGKAHVVEPVAPSTEPEKELDKDEKVPEPISRSISNDSSKPMNYRVPPPAFDHEQDERSLNAAAAREVTRELEALKGKPPSPTATQQPQSETTPNRGRPTIAVGGLGDQPHNGRDTSPLIPPSAPFAARSVSPHPYAELNPNTPAPAPYGGQYSPGSQPYPQPYQSSTTTPAQSYAQSYQSSNSYSQPTTPDGHSSPTSSRPPRFQALDSPVPPRFQAARSQSPGSPVSTLPPRFQTSGSTQIPPPTISMPEQQEPRFGSLKSEGSTPYRTPPEYPNSSPRQLGANTAFTKSTSSLNTTPIPAMGARTISAAAFKRPRNPSADNMGTSGDFMKKSLPSSPYPARDQLGPNVNIGRERSASTGRGPSPAPVARPLSTAQGGDGDDDHYDYISAYVNSSDPNTPAQAEFAHNGPDPKAPAHVGKAGGGYGEGRFATDLDDGGLR
ncbi:hypothetical protein GALMADRAFT_117708 [Galerina marginata CBS 339.88]|uniref:Eisosome component PIL1-domain-containing protein n=1 Tax=Galerina marginata (strain CBS 339.88) TaxID=685588 RepID=A0A067THU7_GALM3|nr:hypothetical protein GALMADRAFT_117708 [Galerina marginata CBS 339.88]